MDIRLTEIEIIPVRPQQGLLAFCSFVINETFCVNDVGIHSKPNGSGYRLVYPAKTLPNGKRINCFYPINHEAALMIERQVAKSFLELQEKVGRGARDPGPGNSSERGPV
jgi:stage V sporulation protein G